VLLPKFIISQLIIVAAALALYTFATSLWCDFSGLKIEAERERKQFFALQIVKFFSVLLQCVVVLLSSRFVSFTFYKQQA
jgi:hypothetical protein